MIRATIATIKDDDLTFEQSTDCDLIGKVIRQGGRRVWVDAVDADPSEREWIGQTFRISGLLLECSYPLFEQAHGLTLCIQQINAVTAGWQATPLLIQATADTLLTSHSSQVTVLNDAFQRETQSKVDWQNSTASLLLHVVRSVMAELIAAQQSVSKDYQELSKTVLDNKRAVDLPLEGLYRWRVTATELSSLARPYALLFRDAANHTLLVSESGITQQLKMLVLQLAQSEQAIERYLNYAGTLGGVTISRQNDELSRRVRGISVVLLIMFPIVISALLTVVLPFPTSILYIVWIPLAIVLGLLSLVVGRYTKLI